MRKNNIKFLNDISDSDTKTLWYAGKYDGIPTSGLMKYKGRKCWFRQYEIDCTERYYTDEQLLKSGYRQEQIDVMIDDDREWYDETFYYKVYRISGNDLGTLRKTIVY